MDFRDHVPSFQQHLPGWIWRLLGNVACSLHSLQVGVGQYEQNHGKQCEKGMVILWQRRSRTLTLTSSANHAIYIRSQRQVIVCASQCNEYICKVERALSTPESYTATPSSWVLRCQSSSWSWRACMLMWWHLKCRSACSNFKRARPVHICRRRQWC
jgi:hypothetical protein